MAGTVFANRSRAALSQVGRPARVWEVDVLRGVAIVLMVVFHLMWDLDYFGIARVDVTRGFWLVIGRTSAVLFLFLVGVSLHLSARHARTARRTAADIVLRQVRRGAVIFGWGLVITAVTWLAFRDQFVRFGILHLIGLSVMLGALLLALGRWNLLLGGGVLAVGSAARAVTTDTPWLVWLGLRPAGFASVDYYPLLPWFGVVLVGIGLGAVVYGEHGRRFRLPDLAARPPARLLGSLGRHSLAIYLLHQPLLIGSLLLVSLVEIGSLRMP